jgi:hypothetical protein
MQALSDVFGDTIISNGIWPASSPDLNPCDFSSVVVWRAKFTSVTPERKGENIPREIANIPAEQVQRKNQNLFRRCEECLRVQYLLWSANCNYSIPNVTAQRVCWSISKIRMCLATGGAPVAVKSRVVNRPTKVRISLYKTRISYLLRKENFRLMQMFAISHKFSTIHTNRPLIVCTAVLQSMPPPPGPVLLTLT